MMRIIRKLHIYFGLGLAILIILWSITGVLLIHKKKLELNKIMINIPWYSKNKTVEGWDILQIDSKATMVATKQGVFINDEKEWKKILDIRAKRLFKQGENIFVVGLDDIYLTKDNGLSWHKVFSEKDIQVVKFKEKYVYVATSKGIYKNDLALTNWEKIIGLNEALLEIRDLIVTENNFLISAKEGVFEISSKSGLKPKEVIANKVDSKGIELQKILKDLHTGDFFGRYFFVIVDLGALGLIAITITGIYIWFKPGKRIKKSY